MKASLTPDGYSDDLLKEIEDDLLQARLEEDEGEETAPSLPIILFSAASGVAGGAIGLYASFVVLELGSVVSAGIGMLALLFSLGVSGAILSAATRTKGAPVNIVFSCVVVILATLFMGVCVMAGAVLAALLAGG